VKLARVVGNLVTVAKVDSLIPVKLYILQVLKKDFKPSDNYIIAIDTIGTAINDVVIYNTGSGARMTELTSNIPTDASIIARVDEGLLNYLVYDLK